MVHHMFLTWKKVLTTHNDNPLYKLSCSQSYPCKSTNCKSKPGW